MAHVAQRSSRAAEIAAYVKAAANSNQDSFPHRGGEGPVVDACNLELGRGESHEAMGDAMWTTRQSAALAFFPKPEPKTRRKRLPLSHV